MDISNIKNLIPVSDRANLDIIFGDKELYSDSDTNYHQLAQTMGRMMNLRQVSLEQSRAIRGFVEGMSGSAIQDVIMGVEMDYATAMDIIESIKDGKTDSPSAVRSVVLLRNDISAVRGCAAVMVTNRLLHGRENDINWDMLDATSECGQSIDEEVKKLLPKMEKILADSGEGFKESPAMDCGWWVELMNK